MDAFRENRVSEDEVRKYLEEIDWRGALTAREVAAQIPWMPPDLFSDLAEGAVFHSPEEVIRALYGEIDTSADDFPAEGAESLGGPAGYGRPSI